MAHGGHRPHSGQGRALPAVQGMLDARPGRCTRCGACACSCIVQSRVRRPGRRGSTTHQPLRRPPRRAIPAHVRTSPRGTQSSLMSCSSGPHRTRDGGCPEAAGSPAVRTATWSGAASAGGIGRRHGRRPVAAGAAAPAAAATAAAAAAAHDSSRRRVTRPRTSPPPPPSTAMRIREQQPARLPWTRVFPSAHHPSAAAGSACCPPCRCMRLPNTHTLSETTTKRSLLSRRRWH